MTSSIHRFVRSLPPPIAAAEPASRARELMRARRLQVAPVVDAHGLLGLVRTSDLMLLERAGDARACVGDVARGAVPFVREAATRGEAIEAMLRRDTSAALVTDGDGAPIGWVALADLVRDLDAAHHRHHRHEAAPPVEQPHGFDEQPE